jgi:hypothetical protein
MNVNMNMNITWAWTWIWPFTWTWKSTLTVSAYNHGRQRITFSSYFDSFHGPSQRKLPVVFKSNLPSPGNLIPDPFQVFPDPKLLNPDPSERFGFLRMWTCILTHFLRLAGKLGSARTPRRGAFSHSTWLQYSTLHLDEIYYSVSLFLQLTLRDAWRCRGLSAFFFIVPWTFWSALTIRSCLDWSLVE